MADAIAMLIKTTGWLCICVALLTAWGCNRAPATTAGKPNIEQVVIGGETFALEVSADSQSRQHGLMERTEIPDHGGMLFVFPDNEVVVQNFWMGNCPIDMDILFLDPRGVVTAAHRMKAEPPRSPNESEAEYDRRMPRYSSGYPAQFAIELKAGTIERLRIRVDDRIRLDLDRLKAMARPTDGR